MEFGEKLRILRKKNHLSQIDLAKRLGVSLRTLSGWENDGRHPKQAEQYDKIAAIFDYDVELLRDDSDLFITKAGEVYGSRARKQAEKIVNDLTGMFAGGVLSEADQDAVMRALQDAYWEAKEANRKYMPFRFRNDP
ncbi:MAG: helix-turn-helix transcriptional regulator [Eubacterium sp.]|nr:helix-turn-helix transcriptional regulator [Eubacterium sp.]